MIDTPNENVKLTFDQLQSIDIAQKRLGVLESEIANATKVLRGTKLECDRAVKELDYQNVLLKDITESVNKSKKELEELNLNKQAVKNILDSLNKEISEKLSVHTAKENELAERETKVSAKETEINSRHRDLMGKENLHTLDKEDFNKKVAKLKEVLNQF